MGTQIAHGSGCPEGKCHQKEKRGGMYLKLSCLQKPSKWMSAVGTALWLEKGNLGLLPPGLFLPLQLTTSTALQEGHGSLLESQMLSPHPRTWLPTPLPGNKHESWLSSTRLTMRVSLWRMYPGLQSPPTLPHKHHVVLNNFCITLCATGLLCSSDN